MKTLVVFTDYQSLPKFYIAEGNHSNWNGVTVNAGAEDPSLMSEEVYAIAEKEINTFIYGDDGYLDRPVATSVELLDAFKGVAEHRYMMAICGFAP